MNAAGLRIALFSGNYNYLKEGANQALNKLVGHLLEQGAAVRVYSPTTATPAFEPAGDLVSVPSIPLPGRSEFRVALGLPRSIRDDVRAFAPNIVHLSAPDWLGTAAQRFGRTLGVAVVASLHTRFETYFDYYGLGLLRDWAWRRQRDFYQGCDLVFAPNAPSVGHLEAMGVDKNHIVIWARGVDTGLFTPARRSTAWRREHGFGADEPILCFFGRLVREKGIADFAAVLTQLRRTRPGLRALVIGGGPAEQEMRRTFGNACFVGHLAGEKLGEAVASADILLNPSLTEAFGNVTLEAMAAGLAVVSADVGSARVLIRDRVDGLLVGPDGYAEAVERLLADPRRLAGIRTEAVKSAQRWSWQAANDAAIEGYRQALSSRKG